MAHRRATRRPPVHVRNARELESLPGRSKRTRQSALAVIARARRDHTTIAQARLAVRANGIRVSRAGVLKYAGPAIERGPGGRLIPTASDRLYRRVPVLTDKGVILLDVRSSRRATMAADYRNAIRAYLEGDDPNGDGLRRFAGHSVGGERFLTNLDDIDAWAKRGEVDELSTEGS